MSSSVNAAQLRGLSGWDELQAFVVWLGFNADLRSHDLSDELPQARQASIARHGARRSQGYGVLLAELDEHPRSFQKLGRHLLETVHDRPLAFCGVRDDRGRWDQLVVLRPRWRVHEKKQKKSKADRRREVLEVARLTVDLDHPTAHDIEVLRELCWTAADDADHGRSVHERINRAFDTEAVTKRFFKGLRSHHEAILAALESASDNPEVKDALGAAGGAQRVALRLLTQTLFVYFLQRKGLLQGERHWLTARSQEAIRCGDSIHTTVLEPLFYEALAKPVDQRPEPWNLSDIPFLNGGLFERLYGKISLPLPNGLLDHHSGLIGFLDGWTFTVAEEALGEPEVAVDPQMLGKVFESLVSDAEKERHGVVYTPRPVVRFMCREALVPYLRRRLEIGEDFARTLLTDDQADDDVLDIYGPDSANTFFQRLDQAAAEVTVLDPAVGSGAFLLGMLTEILRLRALAYRYCHGGDPDVDTQHGWKVKAIGHSLFGVDIESDAVQICMLRLWLSLLVDATGTPDPLPNLDYRIVCADSLTDYANGVRVQNTKLEGEPHKQNELSDISADIDRLTALRAHYFDEADPESKHTLREAMRAEENQVITDLLERAKQFSGSASERDRLDRLAEEFTSSQRRMPVFMPSFTSPQIWNKGGWDLVLLNPPYLARRNLPADVKDNLARHYGRTMDLMVHFGLRAFDYTCDGGAVALIGTDTWFTSGDALELRQFLFNTNKLRLRALARTRCFEGVAVNGGVFVAEKAAATLEGDVRWVENHGCSPDQMLGASMPAAKRRNCYPIGATELWVVPLGVYTRLPHRPAFRPSPEARELLARYGDCVAWRNEFSELYEGKKRGQRGWGLLGQTGNLTARQDEYRKTKFYDQLTPGQYVLAGLVIEGGEGLSTGDDRQFIGVLDGTAEAEHVRTRQADYIRRAANTSGPRQRIRQLRSEGLGDEAILLVLNQEFPVKDLGWPRIGLIRIANPDQVYRHELSDSVKKYGLSGATHWVPFEKSDRSDNGAGAKWLGYNSFVIDWSTDSVALLRERAKRGPRKPHFRNERAWGRPGLGWNNIASYLRARRIQEGTIFDQMVAKVSPLHECPWLSANVLLALLNSSVADFCLRTFLGSRNHVNVGDVRALPVPVIDQETSDGLDALAEEAIAAKAARDRATDETNRQIAAARLEHAEAQIDSKVLALYGLDLNSALWVIR